MPMKIYVKQEKFNVFLLCPLPGFICTKKKKIFKNLVFFRIVKTL